MIINKRKKIFDEYRDKLKNFKEFVKIDNYNNHSRKISYIEFLLEEVNIENDIQKYALNMKEELEKYYENNINQYMSKENRNVEYIIFNKKKYADNFVPTNFEIKEYFNANKELDSPFR